MPTTAEVNTAATNFIADTDTADEKINGVAGTVTDRHGVITNNLQQIFQDIGYLVPVAYTSGLTPSDGSFTVEYSGAVYSAKPSSLPFTTGASFDANQWLLVDAVNGVYNQGGAGAVNRSVSDRLKDALSVLDFDVVGDGVTDDTVGIQDALAEGRLQDGGNSKVLYWPKGTYLITASLTVGTNQTVIFDPGVVINFVPPSVALIETSSLFNIANQERAFFHGNGATLNGTKTGAVNEGSAAAFYLYGSDFFQISDFEINNFATDGITVSGNNSGSGPSRNGVISNVVVDGCRRNGISVISAQNVTLINPVCKNSAGAPAGPWAGIDVEPNDDCFLDGVVIINPYTEGNTGNGLLIVPGSLSVAGSASDRFDVSVVGGRSYRDGAHSAGNRAGLQFSLGGAPINSVYGNVSVTDYVVEEPLGRGVSWQNWDADKCPRVSLDRVTVIDPDYSINAGTNTERSGFVLYADSGQVITNMGNVKMRDCQAIDTRGTARMTWGAIIAADSGKSVKNVSVVNPKSVNQAASATYDCYTSFAEGAGSGLDVQVVYEKAEASDIGSSVSIAGYGGKLINATTAASLTLPSASLCEGLTYHVQCDSGVDSVTLAVQSGDTIEWHGRVASGNLILDDGAMVSVRSQGGTSWIVERLTGRTRMAGQAQAKQVSFGTAAPTSGAWERGDIVFNTAPSAGGKVGWACVTAGSPGTWKAFGAIDA